MGKENQLNTLGLVISVFIGIILATVLIPIIANTAEEHSGQAETNQATSFIYPITTSLGHNVTSGNNATVYNTSFVVFDSVNDYVSVPTAALIGDRNWTLLVVLNWTGDLATNQSIVSKAVDGTNGEFSFLVEDGYLAIRNGEGCAFNSSTQLASLGYVQVGVMRVEDSTTHTGDINVSFIYEGVVVDTQNLTEGCTNFSDGLFTFGANTTVSQFYNGSFDSVKFYSVSLSSASITTSFTGDVNASLVYRWKFNENGGSVAYETEAGNNGTLVGAVFGNDGITKAVPSTDFSVSDVGVVSLPSDFYEYDYVTVNYDYDDMVATFSSGIKAVMTLISVLFGLGVILYCYLWAKNNLFD